jgi:regulator of replication initiation timing
MSDMSNYLSNEIGKAVADSNNLGDQQLRNIFLRGLSIEQQKAITGLQDENIRLKGENKKLKEENATLKNRMYNSEDDAEEYEELLCKPMLEIAQKNGNFKKTYEAQMQIMADWMVSQKAFKELAIQFGFKQGLSAEKVVQIGSDKEIDVLENKHNPEHNTNVGDSVIIGPRVEVLKQNYYANRK